MARYAKSLWLLAWLVLCCPVLAQQHQRYNVFTMDKQQQGFGDLMSNWHVARFLSRTTTDPISFYVSLPFHPKFRIVEPSFNPDLREQQIAGITVYSATNDEVADPQGASTAEARGEIQTMLAATTNERVCNLAFTAAQRDIMRQVPDYDHAEFGYTSLTYKILATATEVEKPMALLGFDYMSGWGPDRVKFDEKAADWMLYRREAPVTLRPTFWYIPNFRNRSLFITKRDDVWDVGTLSLGTDYLGFAHADSLDAIRYYIGAIERMADANGGKTYAIVVTKGTESGRIAKNAGDILPASVSGEHQSVLAGNPATPVFREYTYGKHSNFSVREYTSGIPFDDVFRIIGGSNLPVLVTGTMSLSQALQLDKPFLYEVMAHHRFVGSSIGQDLVGKQAFTSILIPNNPNFKLPVDRSERHFNQTDEQRRDLYLFGLGKSGFDAATFNKNYAKLRTNINRYRKASNRPTGHLLDNIGRFCEAARATWEAIQRKKCATKKPDALEQCIISQLKELNKKSR
ncbi:MAG: hypothetical protein QNJ14_17150 [Woeseiaceae bacterium]|nr:hypothetical protein [Woeseiaceae bacterium]